MVMKSGTTPEFLHLPEIQYNSLFITFTVSYPLATHFPPASFTVSAATTNIYSGDSSISLLLLLILLLLLLLLLQLLLILLLLLLLLLYQELSRGPVQIL
jgi:hypothetical protein